MPAAITIRFAMSGAREVDSAFASIEKRARQLGDHVANDTIKTSARRLATERKTSDQIIKLMDRVAAQSKTLADKIESSQKASADRSATAQAKAAAKASAAEMKEFDRRVAEHKRAEDRKTKALEAAERNRLRIQSNSLRMEQAERLRAEHKHQARISSFTNSLGRAGRSTYGAVAGVAGAAGLTGGVMAVGSALMSHISLREQAAQLVNATRSKNGQATQDVVSLTGEAQGAAARHALDANDVMGAMANVAAKAGGAPGLRAFQGDLDDLAQTAVAAGVSIQDMGNVFAGAFNAGVKPGEEMRQLMRDFVAMGKEGAIEFKDLAEQLPQMAGAGRMFGSGAGMMREAVAMSQFAVKQSVGPEESRTAVMHAITELAMKSDVLKKSGINAIDDKTGKLRSPVELIAEAMQAAYDPSRGLKFGKGQTKFGPGALATLFGARGMAISNVMTDTFMAAGKGESGKRAVISEIRGMQSQSMSQAERDASYATAMGEPAAQLRMSFEQFKVKIGELLPKFVDLLPSIIKATEAFAKLAVIVGNNPLKSIGAIFAANVGKELAAAGLSKVLSSGISAILSARSNLAGGGIGGSLGWNKNAGNLMAGIAITAAAVTLIAAGVNFIDKSAHGGKEAGERAFAAYQGGRNLLGELRTFERQTTQTGIGPSFDAGASEEAKAERAAKLQDLLTRAQQAVGEGTAAQKQYKEALTSGNPLTSQGAESGGAGVKVEEVANVNKALNLFIASLQKAAGDVAAAGGNIANPANPARTGAPPGMK